MRKSHFLSIYIPVLFLVTIIFAFRPDYNWDMLPYMAIIEKMDGIKSFDQIHTNIYKTAKENIPAKKYDDLVNANDKYRTKMLKDELAFETQLPFFDIKPFYLIVAFISYKIGVSLTYATVLPSLISFFFINIVSFLWCCRFNLSFISQVIILAIICIVTIPLATRSNPDTLACLFLLISSYLFLETDKLLLSALFLIFSILVRPENIIFSFLLFSIVLAGKWKKKIPLFISLSCLLLMAAAYYVPIKIMSYPGWSNLFYHAFIDNTVDPSIKQTITVPLYLKVVHENILDIKGIVGLICVLLLSTYILLSKNLNQNKTEIYKFFYGVIVIWAITKTLLFPMPGLRFVIPPVLFIIFTLIKEYELFFFKTKATV